MTDEHAELRDWSAAYTLGALEPEERRIFEDHMARCTTCTEAVGRFAPLPGALARVDPDVLGPLPPDDLLGSIEQQARADVRALARSRGRWRIAALAAGGAAALVLVLLIRPEAEPPPGTATTVRHSLAEQANVLTEPRAWGTAVTVELGGLPHRPLYRLWTVSVDGAWTTAATWGPTPEGRAIVSGATSTSSDELHRIVVTSVDADDILVEAEVG